MNPTLLTVVVAISAIVIIYVLWIGVHLIARKRMGIRQIGCRGPVTDDFGNEVCCHTGESCTKDSTGSDDDACGL